ncbi:MAG: serine/threonine protein kinase, partial [Gammaproteobacteria bacterium]|nr:serine/threonine protein kinase [Gammaproteobacteria bacterium]
MTDILKYDVLPAAARVGAFEIKQALSVSRYGVTYRVWDTHRECDAAIREYLPSDYAKREKGGLGVIADEAHADAFEDGLAKFLQEARSLSQIHDPYVTRVTEYMETNGTAYLVMEFEAGQTLKEYLAQQDNTLREDDLKALLLPMLKALRVVHSAEILHRDINPAHLFLRETGPAVLLGFGNVRPDAAGQERTASPISPGYSAIEQYQDHGRLGPWTDIYALGASMYRCIAGADPVDATARIAAIAEEREDPLVPALEIGRGDYSTSLLGTIDWMLQPASTDRPDCAGAVLGLLAEDIPRAASQVKPPPSGHAFTSKPSAGAPPAPRAAKRPPRPVPALNVPPLTTDKAVPRTLPVFTRPSFVLGSVILVAG